MSNIERTASCPPQLSVEESSGGSSEDVQHTCDLDIKKNSIAVSSDRNQSLSSSCQSELSPVKSSISGDMLRGVDMTELVRKLSGQRQCNTDSSEGGHDEDEDDNEDEEGGAHDTITSLAGAHLLQKFSRIGSGRDRKFRAYKNKDLKGSITQLENLFKEDPLLEEDEKVIDDHEVDTQSEDDVFTPPDGGYGWFVSLGAFLSLFWTAGLVKSYGVLFAEMLRIWPGNISLASWIPAVMTTTALAMAPVASALCQKFNCRYVTAMGSILAFSGVTLSAIMPNLQCLFVTLGMLTGMGIGLATTPGIILTARYFDKRRSLANALCLSGTAAGSSTLPILISYLLDQYGFHGTLLILGACLLNVLVSAALYRPLATHVIIIRNEERRKAKLADACNNINTDITPAADLNKQTVIDNVIEEQSNNNKKESIIILDNRSEDGSLDNMPLSSSLPANPMMGTPGSAHKFVNDECMLANKRNSIHSSFDSISMMSSVSQDYHDHGDTCSSAQWSGRNSPSINHQQPAPVILDNAKSLSLRELALHQIGSHLSLYKSMFIGSGQSSKQNVCEDGCKKEHRRMKEAVSNLVNPRRSSYMFSIEDIMVDSTSVLKDSRHPSHAHLDRGETHRVVNLNRTQSAVGEIKSRKKSGRQRFYSENTFDKEAGISRNSSFCQRSIAGARMELIGSSELFATNSPKIEPKQTRKFTLQPVTSKENIEKDQEKPNLEEKKHHISETINKYIKLSLVKDPVFLLMTGSVMFMAIGVPHCLFFLPTHAKQIGLPFTDASFLLSLSAIFDLAGRLSLGFILDLNLFPKYIGYSMMMFISGISAIILPSTETFTQVAICMGFYGLGSGGWFLMVPLLLAENLGVENIASSYGLARLFQSVTNFSGPILAGVFMDMTGKPDTSFYFMGTSMLLGSLLILLLPLAQRKGEERKQNA